MTQGRCEVQDKVEGDLWRERRAYEAAVYAEDDVRRCSEVAGQMVRTGKLQ